MAIRDPKMECIDRKELEELQSRRLCQQVKRCYENVECFRNRMDEAGLKGYACPENFERLRRCELLAAEKQAPVAQIAMAWIFNRQPLDVFALSGSTHVENMKLNITASEMKLSSAECAWLDIETETR